MTDGLILRSESWQLELAGRVNFCFIKMILFSGYFQIPDQDLNPEIQISFRDEQHFILPASRLLLIASCCQCLSRLLEERGILGSVVTCLTDLWGVRNEGWLGTFLRGLCTSQVLWCSGNETEPVGCPCDSAQQDCGRKSLGSTAALEVKEQERGCHRLFFSPDRIRTHQRIFWSNSEEKYFHKNVLVLPLKTPVALNKQCLLLIQPSGDEVWAQHSATLPSWSSSSDMVEESPLLSHRVAAEACEITWGVWHQY